MIADAPSATRPSPVGLRFRTMARVGLAMMLHDKLKMVGTLTGVIFAVLLSNQQAGTFLGLLYKNTMFVDNAGADLWLVPASTQTLQPGKAIPLSSLFAARVTPGVAWAEPLLFGGGTVNLPGGGSEQVSLVGTRAPRWAGGPFNVVAGTSDALARRDTMIFEDSEREKLGGLNLGSVREVNGYKAQVGGFTWGLLPFGPSYAFAEFDFARSLLHFPSDQASFVLAGLAPGADLPAVQAAVAARTPDVKVMTKKEFNAAIVHYLLFSTAIGITFGVSTVFGLLIGFVIVSLSMFSAVVDNVREFGTLKAIGATNADLAKLLFVQSIAFALVGSLIGLALVSQVAGKIRSPGLAMLLPPEMMIGTTLLMIVICIVASSLALLRLRSVEPGMVFR